MEQASTAKPRDIATRLFPDFLPVWSTHEVGHFFKTHPQLHFLQAHMRYLMYLLVSRS